MRSCRSRPFQAVKGPHAAKPDASAHTDSRGAATTTPVNAASSMRAYSRRATVLGSVSLATRAQTPTLVAPSAVDGIGLAPARVRIADSSAAVPYRRATVAPSRLSSTHAALPPPPRHNTTSANLMPQLTDTACGTRLF